MRFRAMTGTAACIPVACGLAGQAHAEATASDAVGLAEAHSPEVFDTGPTTVLDLPDGARVDDYLSDFAVRVAGKDNRPLGIVESSVPLRNGGEPTDLVLNETASGFAPGNPAVDLHLPDSADGAVAVGQDRAVVLRVAGASNADGVRHGQQVVWPDALADTDMLATPLPYGVETFFQLRSPEAPRRIALHLELRDAQQLRLDALSGRIDIVREGQVVGVLLPPAAVDAHDKPVAVHYDLDGDTVTLVIEGEDLAYPVMVDPVLDYQFGSDTANANGFIRDAFGWYRFTQNLPAGQSFSFVPNLDNQATGGSCPRISGGNANPSLCVGSFSGAGVNYGALALGEWRWRPPAGAQNPPANPDGTPNDAYIYRMDLRSSWFATSATVTNNLPYFYAGLYSPKLDNWIGVNNRAYDPATEPQPPTTNNPITFTGQSNASQNFSSFYRTYCLSAGCSDVQTSDNADGVYARWGVGTAGNLPGAVSTMQGAALYQSDRTAPTVGFVNSFGAAWTKSTSLTSTVSGRDKGMGMSGVGLLIPRAGSSTPDNPRLDNSCDGTRINRCPLTLSNTFTFSTASMPEGRNIVTAAAKDILGKTTPGTFLVNVDRSGPTVSDLAAGSAANDLLKAGTGNKAVPAGTYTLAGAATDGATTSDATRRSGVVSLELLVNGTAIQTKPFTCATDSCPQSTTFSFDLSHAAWREGANQVAIRATDAVGNLGTSSPTTVYVDRAKPKLNVTHAGLPSTWSKDAAVATTVTAEDPDPASGISSVAVNRGWRLEDRALDMQRYGAEGVPDASQPDAALQRYRAQRRRRYLDGVSDRRRRQLAVLGELAGEDRSQRTRGGAFGRPV